MLVRLKLAVIVNTSAGNARTRWPEAARLLTARVGPFELRRTEARGHATQLVRELIRDGFDTIVAAGGDGTLNEIANGVLAGGEVRLGVLPLARGGDFARTLGIPALHEAVEALAAGRTRRIDAVMARYQGPDGPVRRAFFNMASMGVGAEAARNAEHWKWLLPGHARYLAAAAPQLFFDRGFAARLRLDGQPLPEARATLISLGNGRYQGGGLMFAPRAELDDGLLDITVVDRTGLLQVAANAPILFNGRIYSHPKVHHYRARRFTAETTPAVSIELDGEHLGTTPLEAEVLPGALQVIVR